MSGPVLVQLPYTDECGGARDGCPGCFDCLVEPEPGRCRICGCTELEACVDLVGTPCRWVGPSLCSSCAVAPIVARPWTLEEQAAAAGLSFQDEAGELPDEVVAALESMGLGVVKVTRR